MVLALEINEFLKKNDSDVRKMVKFMAKTGSDTDLFEDLYQNFYLVLIGSDTLGKFVREQEETDELAEKRFACYIWSCCRASVLNYMKCKKFMELGPRFVSSVQDVDTGEEVNILDVLNVSDNQGVFKAIPTYVNTSSSMAEGFNEEKFETLFEAFNLEIKGNETLAEGTKQRYLRYLMSARLGEQTGSFAEEEKVSAPYISKIKSSLRVMFLDFRDRYDRGLGLGSDA